MRANTYRPGTAVSVDGSERVGYVALQVLRGRGIKDRLFFRTLRDKCANKACFSEEVVDALDADRTKLRYVIVTPHLTVGEIPCSDTPFDLSFESHDKVKAVSGSPQQLEWVDLVREKSARKTVMEIASIERFGGPMPPPYSDEPNANDVHFFLTLKSRVLALGVVLANFGPGQSQWEEALNFIEVMLPGYPLNSFAQRKNQPSSNFRDENHVVILRIDCDSSIHVVPRSSVLAMIRRASDADGAWIANNLKYRFATFSVDRFLSLNQDDPMPVTLLQPLEPKPRKDCGIEKDGQDHEIGGWIYLRDRVERFKLISSCRGADGRVLHVEPESNGGSLYVHEEQRATEEDYERFLLGVMRKTSSVRQSASTMVVSLETERANKLKELQVITERLCVAKATVDDATARFAKAQAALKTLDNTRTQPE